MRVKTEDPPRLLRPPFAHDAVTAATIVLEEQPGILAPPLDYECVWTDKGSGAMFNGSVWRPIPPPGYVALGHAVGGDKGDGYTGPERPITALVDIYNGGDHGSTIQLPYSAISKAGWNKPGLDRVWCVRKDLVTEGDVDFIYEDQLPGLRAAPAPQLHRGLKLPVWHERGSACERPLVCRVGSGTCGCGMCNERRGVL